MFRPMLHALALHKLGLTRPLRFLMLLVLLGCVVAGLIYTALVFHSLTERNRAHHVQPHSTR